VNSAGLGSSSLNLGGGGAFGAFYGGRKNQTIAKTGWKEGSNKIFLLFRQ